MSAMIIDYFFWASSDWTYLGHRRLLDIAAQCGASVRYRPVRMMPLLKATGGLPLGERSQARQEWRKIELKRWTSRLNMPINMAPDHFPVDNEKALRLMAGADMAGHDIGDLVEAIMTALWVGNRDISDISVLTEVAGRCGIPADVARGYMDCSEADAVLSANTDAAIAAGAFGAPTYVANGDVFWGQDRLGQLTETLMGNGYATAAWFGKLTGIFTAELAGVEMESLSDVEMLAGIGVKGDRYTTAQGYYSSKPHADRQVTLIEEETLEALARDHGITVLPEETRRNLLTRGVPLNHLVGRRFRIGDVELIGGRLNVPCKYLERLLDRKVFDPLINRSGLNCRILNSGTIRVGDPIVPID